MKMKFLIIVMSFIMCASAAEITEEPKDKIREKRGFLAAPIPISYSSHYVHHSPSVAVSYHAPIAKYVAPVTAIKVFQPIPVAKVFAPAVSYTKIPYTSILPYHGYAHGYEHGFGHFL